MGNVAVTFKILPASPGADLEKMKKEIGKKMEIRDSKIEPLAFGLNALRILIVVPDKELGDIENKIRSVEGVSEVEVESSTLI